MIYLASSWRNNFYEAALLTCRAAGLDVYDFKDETSAFRWSDIPGTAADEPELEPQGLVDLLQHPIARKGFDRDMDALAAADTCVLILPCGRSAHLELGYAVGAGKRTAILLDDPCRAELMYSMVDFLATSLFQLLGWLGVAD